MIDTPSMVFTARYLLYEILSYLPSKISLMDWGGLFSFLPCLGAWEPLRFPVEREIDLCKFVGIQIGILHFLTPHPPWSPMRGSYKWGSKSHQPQGWWGNIRSHYYSTDGSHGTYALLTEQCLLDPSHISTSRTPRTANTRGKALPGPRWNEPGVGAPSLS